MATGTTLANLLLMLKAELSSDTDSTVSPGADAVLKIKLGNTQKWLGLNYDFSDLNIRRDISLAAGTRYYDFPTTGGNQDFNLNRKLVVECYWSNLWYSVTNGILPMNYNTLNPELGMKLDPVIRWKKYLPTSGPVQIEVWPLPATATRLRLTGQKAMAALANDNDTCELDDLLIVQFTAAKELARMQSADAPAMLSEANKTLARLVGGDNSEDQTFNMNGRRAGNRQRDDVPTVAVNYTP